MANLEWAPFSPLNLQSTVLKKMVAKKRLGFEAPFVVDNGAHSDVVGHIQELTYSILDIS